MLKIVEYSDQYLKDITELFNLWDDIPNLTTEEMEKTIEGYEINTDNKAFLTIDDNGNAVGYIFVGTCYYLGTKPFLEIMQIMIKEEYRGKGIGKMMMDYVIDMYYRKGIRQVRLHSRVILTKAHDFYKKLGFREFKQSKFFVKDL